MTTPTTKISFRSTTLLVATMTSASNAWVTDCIEEALNISRVTGAPVTLEHNSRLYHIEPKDKSVNDVLVRWEKEAKAQLEKAKAAYENALAALHTAEGIYENGIKPKSED